MRGGTWLVDPKTGEKTAAIAIDPKTGKRAEAVPLSSKKTTDK